ncbi:preprotein translocase subunit SecE [Arcanobacterium hippocoleae]|uniref:Protein translocase subunit SecE n=1 Tax=Arcanobacterium hippocoleae TaxID=149017 RepID=A0ABU1T566_9ACTO|nr:preprotein translocase subunit SecE [Arcanobacterium hippocoleae]MDR6940021.1 preprotein translocase subunit SecE [Arcanobacterium hippocoleae]
MNEVATEKQSFFARIITFFKQVLAEFKKVRRPSWEELGKMFLTVITFLVIVMVFVGILDLVFGQLVFWIFG